MDLINTNRLHITVRRFGRKDKPAIPARGSFRSRDHGGQRPETTWYFVRPLWQVSVKWRPDGKYGYRAGS